MFLSVLIKEISLIFPYWQRPRLASIVCNTYRQASLHAWKWSMLNSMFCSPHLEVLNDFSTRKADFSFGVEPCKLCRWCCWNLDAFNCRIFWSPIKIKHNHLDTVVYYSICIRSVDTFEYSNENGKQKADISELKTTLPTSWKQRSEEKGYYKKNMWTKMWWKYMAEFRDFYIDSQTELSLCFTKVLYKR